MATVRRRKNYTEWVLAAFFLFAYLFVAKTMEGLNFDTIFIAIFCTFLSVFVARCARGFFTGR
jgi:hypothetical protein